MQAVWVVLLLIFISCRELREHASNIQMKNCFNTKSIIHELTQSVIRLFAGSYRKGKETSP